MAVAGNWGLIDNVGPAGRAIKPSTSISPIAQDLLVRGERILHNRSTWNRSIRRTLRTCRYGSVRRCTKAQSCCMSASWGVAGRAAQRTAQAVRHDGTSTGLPSWQVAVRLRDVSLLLGRHDRDPRSKRPGTRHRAGRAVSREHSRGAAAARPRPPDGDRRAATGPHSRRLQPGVAACPPAQARRRPCDVVPYLPVRSEGSGPRGRHAVPA
jgi:hypothetical protein